MLEKKKITKKDALNIICQILAEMQTHVINLIFFFNKLLILLYKMLIFVKWENLHSIVNDAKLLKNSIF